jgi:hypothetical protein
MRLLSLETEGLEIPHVLKPFVFHGSVEELTEDMRVVVLNASMLLGDQYKPERCFAKLPLTSRAWGDGGHYDPDPPYHQYESVVREFMVLIMRGANPEQLWLRLGASWQERHIEEALREARTMVERGISPF